MAKLYLDDVRTPTEDGWDIVRNFDEFMNYIIYKGIPEEVSFDHDLHDEHYHYSMYKGQLEYSKLYKTFKHKTGLHCAIELYTLCKNLNIPLPLCNVHSLNPAGSKNIHDYLVTKMMMDGDEDPTVTTNQIPYEIL